ncbi:MAG: acyl-CoA dehydrogenase family protein [Acidimicrobiia bacterium]
MHERWADEVAAALGPVVAGRHREIDALGRLPDDVVAAMHTSGLFRTWVPDELGGRDATMAEGLELIEELSRLDAALGWVTMINITTSWIAGSIGRDAAREVFGPDRSVAAGTTAPMGRAVEVDGGLRLSGRWAWGSGVHNSSWMACGALVEPASGGDGRARAVMAVVPIGAITVLDTWHTTGMRGTGSADYECHDVFVPWERVVDPGRPLGWSERPLHRIAVYSLLALAVSSVAVGVGRRALEEFRALAAGRTLLGTSRPIATSPVAQTAYARAEAMVRSAAAFKDRTVADAWVRAEEGRLDRETRRLLRLAATNATFAAADAIDALWEVAGAAVVYDTEVFGRLHRDIHVITQHFRVAQRTWEMNGALALDQPFEGQF